MEMCSKFSILADVKKIATLISFILSLCLAVADESPQRAYISKYAPVAVSEMQRSGVPASITLAQGILESDSGRSTLAVKANNHFGIKCHRTWKGKTYRMDDDAKDECFRVYPSVMASFSDHSDFLRYNDRYKSLFDLDPTDYKGWAKGLKAAGYATSPTYAQNLISLIERFELFRFDDGGLDIPETPHELEAPKLAVMSFRHDEVISVSLTRQVYTQNGVEFIYAMAGETYASIAASRNLFLKEILSFNDASLDRPLEKDEVVYIQRKKTSAAPGVDKYIVGADDRSLRDIAQRFGVRMKSIVKLNNFPAGYVPAEGDTILLRKN